MLYPSQSALGQVRMQAERECCFIGTQYSNLYTAVDTPAEAAWTALRPYHPQVPGAEFGLGVRWRLALTSWVSVRTRWQSTGGGF